MAVRLEYSVIAKCRPEHVWEKFEKLEQWAWWNPVIGSARWIAGAPWQKGSRFEMQLVRGVKSTFQPVILECAPPTRIGWMGKGLGIKGEHWFSFEPQADGTTLIKTWEDFSGLLILLAGESRRKAVVDMYAEWLGALKTEAERIAREQYARS